jgi:hypothetical protein
MGLCGKKKEKKPIPPDPLKEKLLFYASFTGKIEPTFAWDKDYTILSSRFAYYEGREDVYIDRGHIQYNSKLPSGLSGVTINSWAEKISDYPFMFITLENKTFPELIVIDTPNNYYKGMIRFYSRSFSLPITNINYPVGRNFYSFSQYIDENNLYMKLYINGVLLFSSSVIRTINFDGLSLMLGGNNTAGIFGHLSITETLTDQEVLDLYNRGGIINV